MTTGVGATPGTSAGRAGRPDAGPGAGAPGSGGGPRVTRSARSPWTDSRFWLLQLIVLALALIRLAVTVSFHLVANGLVLALSTILVFAVPVVVAALAYGLPGGLATTAWTTALCIPRVADAAAHHRTAVLWAELLQLAALAVVALLIGQRVSVETRIREQADTARIARLRAELLYQDMFESNRSPILIVDAHGFVVGSNPSADRVFGSDPAPRRLVDVVGAEAAALVLTRLVSDPDDLPAAAGAGGGDAIGSTDDRVPPVAFQRDGRPVFYRPTATLVGDPGSDRRMQVIFEDVTVETRRHDLMEAYAGQVVLGQEEERRHLAQELHDGPLQTLIHLCRQIDAVVAVGGTAADDRAGALAGAATDPRVPGLASMRTTVEETVAELRSIARGLRPSVLDDLGLAASLNQVVLDASRRQGFESTFDIDGTTRRLPAAVELTVFRIGQEAVTNVERHAGAHHLAVRLEFGPTGLGLTVEDDGAGFDPTATGSPEDSGSLGLPGMGERARLVGGRLHVRSAVGAGTTVRVWVPVEAAAPS